MAYNTVGTVSLSPRRGVGRVRGCLDECVLSRHPSNNGHPEGQREDHNDLRVSTNHHFFLTRPRTALWACRNFSTVLIDSNCLVTRRCLCAAIGAGFRVIENSARSFPTCFTSRRSFLSIQICPFSNGARFLFSGVFIVTSNLRHSCF